MLALKYILSQLLWFIIIWTQTHCTSMLFQLKSSAGKKYVNVWQFLLQFWSDRLWVIKKKLSSYENDCA